LTFQWWFDERASNRVQRDLETEVRENVSFLFLDEGAQVIPNNPPPPRVFDLAQVTLKLRDLLLIFIRGRGELFVHVAARRAPRDWHELSRVLAAIGTPVSEFRRSPLDLFAVDRLLRLHMTEIKTAFSDEQYANTLDRLRDIQIVEDEASHRLEARINRNLYGR
jgi:hypothetical protein